MTIKLIAKKSKPIKQLYKAYIYLKYFKNNIANDIRSSVWSYIKRNGMSRSYKAFHDAYFIEGIVVSVIKQMINPVEVSHLKDIFNLIRPVVLHIDSYDTFDEFLFDIILFGDQLYYTIFDLKEIIMKLSEIS